MLLFCNNQLWLLSGLAQAMSNNFCDFNARMFHANGQKNVGCHLVSHSSIGYQLAWEQTNLQANVICALNMRQAAVQADLAWVGPITVIYLIWDRFKMTTFHRSAIQTYSIATKTAATVTAGFNALIGCRWTQLDGTVVNAPWKWKNNRFQTHNICKLVWRCKARHHLSKLYEKSYPQWQTILSF